MLRKSGFIDRWYEKFAKARMSAVVETVGESRLDTATEAALIGRTRLHFNLTIFIEFT